jgi:hypothetical protein
MCRTRHTVTQLIIQCSDTQLSVHDVTDGDVIIFGLNTALLLEAEGYIMLQVCLSSAEHTL